MWVIMVEKTLHILAVLEKFYRTLLRFVFFFFFFFLMGSKRQFAMIRLSFIVILCRVGSAKTTLMRVGHYGRKKLYAFWQFQRNSIDLFLGSSFFYYYLFIFFYRIQNIGCYDWTEFYSNFVSCGKHKDDINACGSLWQKKLNTIWQFWRNSIDLFLGLYFFFSFPFLIESKRQVPINRLSFTVISCRVGIARTTLIHVGHYGRKNFTYFGSFGEILQNFASVRLFFFFLIEFKRQVAMTRLSFIVISCHVGSAKKTLICVGHYGRKNFTHFGSFGEILQGQNWPLPFLKKQSCILPHFPNYLGKCPSFETRFSQKRSLKKNRKNFRALQWRFKEPIVAFWNLSSMNSSYR